MEVGSRPRGIPDWLLRPELETCVVGSSALAEACRRAGIAGPAVADRDLAWRLDVERGERLLRQHGAWLETTAANRARGTLAFRADDGGRIEITAFRGDGGDTADQRIARDLALRDMTIGALAWHLASDRILDPLGGLEHWRQRRIVACGDPGARIAEHPVWLLRYYRRAWQWQLTLDRSIRKATFHTEALRSIPAEAVAAELRQALQSCASPGSLLVELHEIGALAAVLPELVPQLDGRPAGPLRHHPEIGQALHLVLALEWAARHAPSLPEADRVAALAAVLLHDLGKGTTDPALWPAHHGHEQAGLPLLDALLDRVPLLDARGRRLARCTCALHLDLRRLDQARPGTLARTYDRWLRQAPFAMDTLAFAVAADVAGRRGHEHEGEGVRAELASRLSWIVERCESVDAGALWQRCAGDKDAFTAALHEARSLALATGQRGAMCDEP